MPAYSPSLVRTIESMLLREKALYKDYIALLDQERKSVTSYQVEKTNQQREQREKLCDAMLAAQEERLAFMRQFPETEGMKLTDVLRKFLAPRDLKRVMPHVDELKQLTTRMRDRSRQFNQVVSFALNIVNGAITISRSATQCVNRAYGRTGKIEESYHSTEGRTGGVLKEV